MTSNKRSASAPSTPELPIAEPAPDVEPKPQPVEAPQATPTAEPAQPMAMTTSPAQPMAVLTMLDRVLQNPEFDVDRLERLWGMQKEIMAKQAETAYIAAHSQMQGEIPSVPKRGQIKNNAGNVQSTYALWEDVNELIKPVMQRHGFAISFRTKQDGPKITVIGILSHRDGHSETTSIELAPDTSGSKNSVQAVGSAVSYGKRYTAGALLNLTSHGEDDDGKSFGDASATDQIMAKKYEFEQAIAEAETVDALKKNVGQQISGSGLPARVVNQIRTAYTKRLNELRDIEKRAA